MKITRYGIDVLSAILIMSLVLVGLAIWTDVSWLRAILILVALFLTVFSLNFFRDPDRAVRLEGRSIEDLVVSPADGKIVGIGEVEEPEYLESRAILISVFMSPVNVHVNRAPISGTVEYLQYVKGEFLVAHDPESTRRNERMMIGMTGSGRKILFAQVAGYIARRIVCKANVGDRLGVGQRFGMIKFGSRVDIYLPLSATVFVKDGEIVRSGETVLASF